MTFYFRYKQINNFTRPIVIFSIKGIEFFGIIDSGADSSIMPKEVAEVLGINIEKLADDEIRTVSGQLVKVKRAYFDVGFKDLRENKTINKVPFHISLDNSLKDIVIGRAGIFDNFTITFEQMYKRVSLKYNPKKVYER